jgi:hypothetical protein
MPSPLETAYELGKRHAQHEKNHNLIFRDRQEVPNHSPQMAEYVRGMKEGLIQQIEARDGSPLD